MNQWYKATVKISFESKNGQMKFKKESYIVFAMTPTDVETKLAEHLGMEDYELVSVNLTNIIDIVK